MKEGIKKRMDELVDLINFHNLMYYVENNPVITDREYDLLFSELAELEAAYPGHRRKDSPIRKVGGEPLDGFKSVDHAIPMLSIDNTYSKEELFAFDERIKKAAGISGGIEYVVELKYDGVAVSVSYNNGLLERGASRGDGRRGDDITVNIKTIRTLPLVIGYKKPIEVRGEIYMRKDDFVRLNAERKKNGLPLFANPRNATAGSLKNLDSATVSSRNLQVFVYQYLGEETCRTHWEALKFMKEAGLPVNPHNAVARNISEVVSFCDSWRTGKSSLPYNIDGLVVKVNSLELRNKLGSTNRAPRWTVAYKFPSEQATTKLLEVKVQVGRTGILTPVAMLDPVELGGTTVSRATLHNFEEISRLSLKVGDRVLIEKGGEVIPKVVKNIPEYRDGSEKEIISPAECPVCGSKVKKYDGEVAVRCPNISCPAQVKERIIHFSSRNAMDIEGLGEKWVSLLVDMGMLSDYGDIYYLHKDKLAGIEGMAEKSASNLIESIIKSRNRPLSRLIFGLGIRHVGSRTSEILAEKFGSLESLSAADMETISSIYEIGPVAAESIKSFFSIEKNMSVIKKLEKAGVKTTGEAEVKKGVRSLEGLSFVITGTLENYTRAGVTELILKNGGRVSGSLSAGTDFLVSGRDPGSKLEKAKKLQVRILGEKELEDMTRGNDGFPERG